MGPIIKYKTPLGIAILAAVYFISARFGLSLAGATEQVTLVWPPTGISIAALLMFGYRFWPGIAIGAFAANILANEPAYIALGIAVGNTLEALTAAYLVRRFTGFTDFFGRVKDVFGFMFFAAAGATAVSASIGVASLVFGGLVKAANYWDVWLVWWTGDALGAAIITPLTMLAANPKRFLPVRMRYVEMFALVVTLVSLGLLIFGRETPLSNTEYIILLPIIWASARFGLPGAVMSTFFTSAIAITATIIGRGPFHGGGSPEASLLLLQLFLFVTATAAYFLGAFSAEREAAKRSLEGKISEVVHSLETAQKITHIGSWQWDVKTNRVIWSKELYDIFRIAPKEALGGYADYLKSIHPEDKEKVNVTVQKAIEDKKGFELYHRIIWPGGEVRMIRGIGQVFTGDNGEVTMMGTAQDVTEQKRAEGLLMARTEDLEKTNKDLQEAKRAVTNVLEDLSESKQIVEEIKIKDEALIESVGDGIIATDEYGRITRVNSQAEAVLGFSAEEFIGKYVLNVLRVVDKNGVMVKNDDRAVVEALATGQRVYSLCSFIHKDGHQVPVSTTVSPIIIDGRPMGVVEVFRDTTKERQVDIAKTEFVSLASHQLRTPLSAINWYTEMLLSGDAGEVRRTAQISHGGL